MADPKQSATLEADLDLPEAPKPAATTATKKKKKKQTGKGKGYRVYDEDITLADLTIPAGSLFAALTKILAYTKKDPRLEAEEKEVQDVEDAFNEWVKLRLPILKKFYPELILLMPIAAYGMRIAALERPAVKKT